jgi:hypothetical protein
MCKKEHLFFANRPVEKHGGQRYKDLFYLNSSEGLFTVDFDLTIFTI